jgi:hypothetical protein
MLYERASYFFSLKLQERCPRFFVGFSTILSRRIRCFLMMYVSCFAFVQSFTQPRYTASYTHPLDTPAPIPHPTTHIAPCTPVFHSHTLQPPYCMQLHTFQSPNAHAVHSSPITTHLHTAWSPYRAVQLSHTSAS